jgi:cell division protein FtsL
MPKLSRILPKTTRKGIAPIATCGDILIVLDASGSRLIRIKCKSYPTQTYEFKNGKFDRMSHQFNKIRKALYVNSIYDMANVDPVLLNFTAGMYNIQFDVYESLEGYIDKQHQIKLNNLNDIKENVNGQL